MNMVSEMDTETCIPYIDLIQASEQIKNMYYKTTVQIKWVTQKKPHINTFIFDELFML